jgi:hypothetical protein
MPQPEPFRDPSRFAPASCRQVRDISEGLCAFEFPACQGCPNAPLTVTHLDIDPMKSGLMDGWFRGSLQRPL